MVTALPVIVILGGQAERHINGHAEKQVVTQRQGVIQVAHEAELPGISAVSARYRVAERVGGRTVEFGARKHCVCSAHELVREPR